MVDQEIEWPDLTREQELKVLESKTEERTAP